MSSTNQTHGQRSSLPYVRKTAVRAARPVPSVKTTGAPKVSFKVPKSPKGKHSKEEDEVVEADQDDMATSFLQFCAMCEKQIVIPNNSILYCSESCRRKDASQISPHNPYLPLLTPTTVTPPDTDDPFTIKPRNILPAHLPTPRPLTAARIPPQAHEGKSDLDPTEWKPNLPGVSSSEAFQYLSQFHKLGSSSLTPTKRPALVRSARSTATVATMTPTLSYTPTASTSSEESLAGTPCEFVAKPLLPPAYSLPTDAKTAEAMTPHVVSSTSSVSVPEKHVVEAKMPLAVDEPMSTGQLSYGKKCVAGSERLAAGSLKKLLNVDEM